MGFQALCVMYFIVHLTLSFPRIFRRPVLVWLLICARLSQVLKYIFAMTFLVAYLEPGQVLFSDEFCWAVNLDLYLSVIPRIKVNYLTIFLVLN